MDSEIIERLKQRLTGPLPGRNAQIKMAPSFRSEVEMSERTIKAGVVILLYPNPVELYLVLMKRTEYPGVHSAQISLPGGKFDPGDQSLEDTALRETFEEIGISPESIIILGKLTPLYIPVSEIEVYPVVAYSQQKQTFHTSPDEVDYLIEAPLINLMDPNIISTEPYRDRRYTGTIPFYNIQGNHVWGATAMILSEFLEVLKSVI